jgi:hypothetical protein
MPLRADGHPSFDKRHPIVMNEPLPCVGSRTLQVAPFAPAASNLFARPDRRLARRTAYTLRAPARGTICHVMATPRGQHSTDLCQTIYVERRHTETASFGLRMRTCADRTTACAHSTTVATE